MAAQKIQDKLHEKVMFAFDPGVGKELRELKKSGTIENFEILLSSKRKLEAYELLKNGPLVLVFIRGTWCPFCRLHLSKLRKWTEALQGKNATIIVVSTETTEQINKWLEDNPVNYLFASDSEAKLGDYFGVHLQGNDYNQAVTFLINTDKSIKLAYTGRRDSKSYQAVVNKV